ncbi:hypothetical protein [Microcoleus sp. bin38.metabat.b11b12b14.051]|uniref:hypothetical protein n=1 Tax=Microcoleus sp. bin38.metabat.b11b12b14.051 TaxID=2742709 RepID=UPI0025E36E7D|nr:hypothetical protein [Microcoleus sp. bin38.metabat.b11b12b14.051]
MSINNGDRPLGRKGRSHLGTKKTIALGDEKGDRTWGRKRRSHLGTKRAIALPDMKLGQKTRLL